VVDDHELRSLIEAIIAGDRDHASNLIAAEPELATAALGAGNDVFFEAITHYVYGGDTPLHAAAACYGTDIVATLLARGADVAARNRRGAQPLHYAADGHPESAGWNPEAQQATITELIDAGADPNARDKSGVAPLHRAVRTRCAAAVAALIAGGADPTLPNLSGSTPLDLAQQPTGRGGSGSDAAHAQQAEIIRLLQT
jgi:hypothetical protein